MLTPLLLDLPAASDARKAAAAINRYAATQAALNIRSISESEVSYGPPRAHREVEVQEVRDLQLAANDFVRSRMDELKDRSRGLWCATILKELQGTGTVALVAVFDHLIVDGWSLRRIAKVARSGATAVPPTVVPQTTVPQTTVPQPRPDPYQEWILRQRRTFVASSPTAEYWRAMFPDKTPNSSCEIAECVNPVAPLSGVQIIRQVELPAPPEKLRALQGRFRTTSFVVLLGTLAASVADGSGSDDVTIFLIIMGRLPGELDIFGCMSNTIPLRIRDRALSDPGSAVPAAHAVWLSSTAHETAPWDFILKTACHPRITDPQPVGIFLNFQPYLREYSPRRFPESFRRLFPGHPPGGPPGIAIDAVLTDRKLIITAKADAARFTDDGLGGFLDRLSAKWAQLLTLCG